jgi:hypothetical protein
MASYNGLEQLEMWVKHKIIECFRCEADFDFYCRASDHAVGFYQWSRLEKPAVLAKPLVASLAGSR